MEITNKPENSKDYEGVDLTSRDYSEEEASKILQAVPFVMGYGLSLALGLDTLAVWLVGLNFN